MLARLSFATFLLIAAVCGTVCTTAAESNEKTPIKLGAIVPLSGPYANFGEGARVGIQLALEEAAGAPNQIEVIYEDSQYEAAKSITAFNKLVDADHVQALIVLGTPPCVSVLPLAEKRGLPVFAWTPSTRLTAGKPGVLRLLATGRAVGQVMAAEAQRQNISQTAYFISQNEYSQIVRDGFAERIGKDNIVYSEEIAPAETDFRTALTKARAAKAKALGICLNTGQIPAFVSQAQQLGLKLPLFGCHAMSSPEVLKTLDALNAKAWFVEGAVKKEFQERFAKRSPDSSGIWIAAAFHDSILLLAEQKLSPEMFRLQVGQCLPNSAFQRSCVNSSNEDGDYSLEVPLGVTRMEAGKFLRGGE